ncbi:MAG: DUF1275 domain-containing protein [Bdellovibrionales bacterium]|nr:DUF1275 domain-containing protein [Bdellovibrionales bacterium]
MIYGNESISYYSKTNIATWMLMAFQAGVLNIGGFMACHRFVSHVTGFATFFGYEINQPDSSHAIGMLLVPLFFLFGAMLSALLVDVRIKLHKKPKYYISFSLIFLILIFVLVGGVSGLFGRFGQPLNTGNEYILLILLCFVCGLQNGTITSVSKSVVRTTHLTGITTDLGIGLIRILNQHKINESMDNEKKATLVRLGIIIFFSLGSVIGGLAFMRTQYLGFVIPVITSGCLLVVMIYFNLKKSIGLPISRKPLE